MPIDKDKKLDKHVSITSVFQESKKPKDATVENKTEIKNLWFKLEDRNFNLKIPRIILQKRNNIKILTVKKTT